MIVETKGKASLLTATILAVGIGVGAAVASSAGASPPPNTQPAGQYVFACVNQDGKIDYLEFRTPLPHQCFHSGETLWHWAASPGPTASASASPSASPSASATVTPTVTPTVTATVTVTVTATPTT
jgi:hypothetical protein